ncbi:hypothetical protein OIN60_08685 [Paenibacillus sp. P96]|uniref:Lipoprotein n=1 Tax=Paenibacillus zeirhizosphaerae TaxID=2987519 RepID=A0ABT9FQ36_9BACL|nr:hypothetical protein [Paenibacillus sp. P96]MDP4096848.1 hypothetical protein [Paenibacillus sp. P96]
MFKAVYGSAAILICLTALLLTGCTSSDNVRSPEEYYSLAMSGLAGKEEFHFQGMSALRLGESGEFQQQVHFEGKLRGHDQLTVRTVSPAAGGTKALNADKPGLTENFIRIGGAWQGGTDALAGRQGRLNPVNRLEELGKLDTEITLEKAAPRGTRMFRIEVSQEDAKRWFAADLKKEMVDVDRRFRRLADKRPASERSKLNAELDAAWKKMNDELGRRMDTAQVRTVYHLTVERRTLLPQRLSSETQIVYKNQAGGVQEESLVSDTFFRDYK